MYNLNANKPTFGAHTIQRGGGGTFWEWKCEFAFVFDIFLIICTISKLLKI